MPFKLKLTGIYKIRNIISGKCYVGQAFSIYSRWSVHRHLLRKGQHHSKHLQSAFLKHGEGAFIFEIIELAETDALTQREQHWMDVLRPAYNILPTARSQRGFVMSEESRAKMSAAKKGKSLSDEHRAAMRASSARRGKPAIKGMLGKKHSAETRAKIAIALAGLNRGRIASAETRAKMSISRMGKKGTMRGRKHTEEARQKMTAAHLKWWENRRAQWVRP